MAERTASFTAGNTDRLEATIVFADVSGFTALTEARDPEEVRELMNECFERIEAVVRRHHGVVDKWIADCAMVVFGLSGDTELAAVRACEAALAIRDAITNFRDTTARASVIDLHIGVNTGIVVAGGVGGGQRCDLTVTGRPVDVAEALVNAAARGQIFVGTATIRATKDRFRFSAPFEVDSRGGTDKVQAVELHAMTRAVLAEAARSTDNRGEPVDTADRRHATVLYAELVGFYEVSESLGPEEIRDLLNRCFTIIESIIRMRGGCIDKWVGRSAMALFGAPRALERAPVYACDAALAIRDAIGELNDSLNLPAAIGVRIGLASGPVVAGEIGGQERRNYTVMGRAGNLAARLMTSGRDRTIFVEPATYQAAQEYFDFSEPFHLELKGISERLAYRELHDRTEALATTGGARRLRTTALVGREREYALLDESLRALLAKRGTAIALCGESGVGKTRLTREFLARAAETGVQILTGSCTPIGRTTGFHPIADLLDRWIHQSVGRDQHDGHEMLTKFVETVLQTQDLDIAEALAVLLSIALPAQEGSRWATMTPDAQERFVHLSLRRLFAAASGSKPLLIAIEDLHWADDSTLGLLESLLRLTREHPIGFLLTFRPGYEESSERLVEFARNHLPANWQEITLPPFSTDETGLLLRRLFDVDVVPAAILEMVRERTAGNPLFIEELTDELRERGAVRDGEIVATEDLFAVSIPETVGGVILSRVERLAAAERTVLENCSVLGRSCDTRVLEHMAGTSTDLSSILPTLVSGGFIVADDEQNALASAEPAPDGGCYRFRHAILQESIYESLLKKRRRDLHCRCARAIETVFAATVEQQCGVLAHHYYHARELVIAEDLLFRAGERAAGAAASREALRYFRMAYETYTEIHGDGGDRGRKALLEKHIGLALLNTGSLSQSIPHLNAALRLRGEWVPEHPIALNVKLVFDLTAILLDLYFGSHERRRRRGGERDPELFEILYNRCRAQNPTDPQRAFFDNLATIRHMRHLDLTRVPHSCGIYSSAGAFFGFSGISFRVADRFLKIAEDAAGSGTDEDRFQCQAMRFVKSYLEGKWEASLEIDPVLVEKGLRAGLLWDVDTYLGLLAEKQIKQGRFAGADRTIEQIARLPNEFGYSFSTANVLANRAFLLAERGSLEGARKAIRRYAESRHESTLLILALSTRATIEARLGLVEDARNTLREAQTLVRAAGKVVPYYLGAYTTASLHVSLLQLEAAISAGRRHDIRVRMRQARTIARHALRIVRSIARERVQVLALCGRLEFARGRPKRAEQRWRAALLEASRLDAQPDGSRVCTEIADALHHRGGSFEGLDADRWRQRAEAGRSLIQA